ncbi:2-octaprenyl-6-methoxyphenyl hydroxylase [Pseudomonadota bacterium]
MLTDDSQFDLTIVGGGMVGASLACALIDTGLRVAVLEAIAFDSANQPSFDERTIALTYGSCRIFEGLGVWKQMLADGATAIERIHISDQGHFGSTVLDRTDAKVTALGYVVPARVLGGSLLARMQQADNITYLCPANCEKINLGVESAQVELSRPEKQQQITSRLLVLADGGRSEVARDLGLVSQSTRYEQMAMVTTIGSDRDHGFTAYERFTKSGPMALLPNGEKSFAVVWTLYPDQAKAYLECDEQTFVSALQGNFGDRAGQFLNLGKRHLYPLSRGVMSNSTRSRLAVIGNAAHTLHPVAGQGFNLGLRDVAVLAQKIVDAYDSGIDIGDSTLLNEYEKMRHKDVSRVSAFTHGLISIFANEFGPLVTARNLGLFGINMLPGLKRHLLEFSMGLNVSATRLGLGQSLR